LEVNHSPELIQHWKKLEYPPLIGVSRACQAVAGRC
jgi:hypothetical protein